MRTGVIVLGVVLALPLTVCAQIPGAPALPGGPVPPAVPGAAGAAPAAPAGAAGASGSASGGNLCSFFMMTQAQKAQLKQCFCSSTIGQFINNMMMPMGLMTGGLLGGCCPGPNTPNPADIGKSATSAQGAAAKIQADEAQAKAKIASLEYLATVDCRYYPEAGAAMINGLRAEKNECVRLAAAKAMGSGCCCNPKVIKALTICVECSNKDGFPAEASELVRAYAYVSLERCLMKCVEAEPDVPPEPPPAAKKALYEMLAPIGSVPDYNMSILLAAYYSPDSTDSSAGVYVAARQTLAKGLQLSPRAAARLAGPRNVRDSLFPPAGRTLAVASAPSQPLTPPRIEVQTAVTINENVDIGQPIIAPALPATEKRTGRGNILNIIQDAMKR